MILLRKFNLGIIKWDPSVMEHLGFVLSICSQTPVLAKQFEEIMHGIYHRIDRWNRMALCCSAAGQNETALNLLKKSLHRHERPEDLTALSLAAKICSDDSSVAAQGVEFARRAVALAHEKDEHLKGVALRVLGLCLASRAKVSPSDSERSHLLSEALKSLEAALVVEPHNSVLILELGLQYAEQRNPSSLPVARGLLSDALRIDPTNVTAWYYLGLVHKEDGRVADAADCFLAASMLEESDPIESFATLV